MLADGEGKGVAAAMLMASLGVLPHPARCGTQKCSRDARNNQSPVSCVVAAGAVCHALYFEFDDATRIFRYVNCGHLAPAILRANGEIERLHLTATVIGLFRQCPCECRDVVLSDKDAVVLFTDGVTRFPDETGIEFGEDRFLALAQSARTLSPKSALSHIVERLTAVRDGSEQFDDQTLAWLRTK